MAPALRSLQRLEGHEDEAAVRVALAAGEGHDVVHAGSLLMTDTRRWTESFITGNEASCGPCTPPKITPVSCCGKKPLGITTTTTTFSAMTSTSTVSVSTELSSTQSSERR